MIDPKEMELSAKVGELERNNIKEGQTVDFQLDALPGNTFHGQVKTVGASNRSRSGMTDSANKFEVSITADEHRPSHAARTDRWTSTSMAIRARMCSTCPGRRLFLKDNKRMVYVRNGESNFDPHEVKHPGGERKPRGNGRSQCRH